MAKVILYTENGVPKAVFTGEPAKMFLSDLITKSKPIKCKDGENAFELTADNDYGMINEKNKFLVCTKKGEFFVIREE